MLGYTKPSLCNYGFLSIIIARDLHLSSLLNRETSTQAIILWMSFFFCPFSQLQCSEPALTWFFPSVIENSASLFSFLIPLDSMSPQQCFRPSGVLTYSKFDKWGQTHVDKFSFRKSVGGESTHQHTHIHTGSPGSRKHPARFTNYEKPVWKSHISRLWCIRLQWTAVRRKVFGL